MLRPGEKAAPPLASPPGRWREEWKPKRDRKGGDAGPDVKVKVDAYTGDVKTNE